MKLDRNINSDGRGKYALLKLRALDHASGADLKAAGDAFDVLTRLGIMDLGNIGSDSEFTAPASRYPQAQGAADVSTRIDETMQVALLVDDLFAKVQAHQGYFHVSDGETFASRAKFFARIRGRLYHGKQAVHVMEAFLRKYGQLRGTQA